MNAQAILTEVGDHAEKYPLTQRPHSINLTLLPLSEDEIAFIDAHLGRGPVPIQLDSGEDEVTPPLGSGLRVIDPAVGAAALLAGQGALGCDLGQVQHVAQFQGLQ